MDASLTLKIAHRLICDKNLNRPSVNERFKSLHSLKKDMRSKAYQASQKERNMKNKKKQLYCTWKRRHSYPQMQCLQTFAFQNIYFQPWWLNIFGLQRLDKHGWAISICIERKHLQIMRKTKFRKFGFPFLHCLFTFVITRTYLRLL